MVFTLSALLDGASNDPRAETLEISGVGADSRAVRAGMAFFALPGTQTHGDAFAGAAVANGATVVVSDRETDEDLGVPVIVLEDVRAAFARAAARVSGIQPKVAVAVTGTNGKTSVASFIRQIWNAAGRDAAAIGTLGVDHNGQLTAGELTTPDPLKLHADLARLKAEGVDYVAMEASSHGLDQRRLDGLSFDVVGFTNLSRDHLDYHLSMDEYREAKLRLFRELLVDGGSAVVNVDDPEYMPFMFAALERGVTLMTVGEEGAYIEIGEIVREQYGQRVRGKLVGEPLDVHIPLTGAFQVSNALMAAAMAVATGVEPAVAVGALQSLIGAKGRLEKVAETNGAAVFVDYSHTPDALKTALNELRPYCTGKLVAIVGAGGDRDVGKRPQMGAVASELADHVIVTDDNPRSEDPATIRAAIMAAVENGEEIGDRGEAIATAVARLAPGDVLLVAGKGHEDYQLVGDRRLDFSDHAAVRAAAGT